MYCEHSNNPCADPKPLPPVLPRKRVKPSAANFVYGQGLSHSCIPIGALLVHSSTDWHHRQQAHNSSLRLPIDLCLEEIDSLSSQLLFKDGWSLPGSQLPNLMDPCGVVAALLPPFWNKHSRVQRLHPTLGKRLLL